MHWHRHSHLSANRTEDGRHCIGPRRRWWKYGITTLTQLSTLTVQQQTATLAAVTASLSTVAPQVTVHSTVSVDSYDTTIYTDGTAQQRTHWLSGAAKQYRWAHHDTPLKPPCTDTDTLTGQKTGDTASDHGTLCIYTDGAATDNASGGNGIIVNSGPPSDRTLHRQCR